jgi:hypothetical protein
MKAHELLSDPYKWTQGGLARDPAGYIVGPNVPHAVSWCLIGAIEKVSWHSARDCRQVQEHLAKAGVLSLSDWNDAEGRTFEEVHSLLVELDL